MRQTLKTSLYTGLLAVGLIAQTTWVPTFTEEFDGRQLNLARWTPHDLATGKAYAADAAEVSGGMLHLAAKPGFITTYSKFAQTYGRFEIVCRVSGPSGARVSFQLMPLPSGDLPAIEFNYSNGKYTFENRWGTPQTQRSYGDTIPGPDLSTGFHTIAIEWDADHISWLVDGKERLRSVDGVPHQPLYLTLEAEGNPESSFEVDALRISQLSPDNQTKKQIADELRREIEDQFGSAQQIVARDFNLSDNEITIYIKTADGEWFQGCSFDANRRPLCRWHLFGQAPLSGIRKSIFDKPYRLK